MEIRQGIDITSVKRIKVAIDRPRSRFISRVFTSKEKAYCHSKARKYEHYAARFAAKEAFFKALHGDVNDQFQLSDIEVRRRATGKPYIYLSPTVRKRLGVPKDAQIELSLTHEREYAMASVVIVFP